MTDKRLSMWAKRIGAKPVDKSGSTVPRLTNTSAEGIWSVEYCRQNPELAAKAIETLQWLANIHDDQNQSVANIIQSFAKELMEIQEIIRS